MAKEELERTGAIYISCSTPYLLIMMIKDLRRQASIPFLRSDFERDLWPLIPSANKYASQGNEKKYEASDTPGFNAENLIKVSSGHISSSLIIIPNY
jgi:hypothetical protein